MGDGAREGARLENRGARGRVDDAHTARADPLGGSEGAGPCGYSIAPRWVGPAPALSPEMSI